MWTSYQEPPLKVIVATIYLNAKSGKWEETAGEGRQIVGVRALEAAEQVGGVAHVRNLQLIDRWSLLPIYN